MVTSVSSLYSSIVCALSDLSSPAEEQTRYAGILKIIKNCPKCSYFVLEKNSKILEEVKEIVSDLLGQVEALLEQEQIIYFLTLLITFS